MARGSAPWLLPAFTAAGLAVLTSRGSRTRKALAVPVVALAAGMAWFFRDPDRGPASGRFLSAADGVVQSVDPLPDGRTRIAVFMNPLNVHVNRAPIAGVVTGIEHRPGGFLPALALILMPKCPACVAAYVALFTGVGVSMSTAWYLRTSAIALCVTSLLFLTAITARSLLPRSRAS